MLFEWKRIGIDRTESHKYIYIYIYLNTIICIFRFAIAARSTNVRFFENLHSMSHLQNKEREIKE